MAIYRERGSHGKIPGGESVMARYREETVFSRYLRGSNGKIPGGVSHGKIQIERQLWQDTRRRGSHGNIQGERQLWQDTRRRGSHEKL